MSSLIAITKHYSYPDWREAAGYVRRGARTVEDVEKLKREDADFTEKTGSKPVEAMSRAELEERVREYTPDTTITKDAPTETLRTVAKESEAVTAKEPEAKSAKSLSKETKKK